MVFWSDTAGVVIGGDFEEDASMEGNVGLTIDGGATWFRPPGNPPGGFRSCVTIVGGASPAALVAVGTSGSDVSIDGSQSWSRLGTTGFHVVAASRDGTAVWAAGSEGRIARLRS